MISKKNRLSEREVKKVLTRWKPFFSYGLVLNYAKNNLEKNRFAIVIWWKSVKTSVERNFFRRRFYDLVSKSIKLPSLANGVPWNKIQGGGINWIDYVFVVKKQTKLDKKDINSTKSFYQDIKFLLNKI
jgi:hypothetical protein